MSGSEERNASPKPARAHRDGLPFRGRKRAGRQLTSRSTFARSHSCHVDQENPACLAFLATVRWCLIRLECTAAKDGRARRTYYPLLLFILCLAAQGVDAAPWTNENAAWNVNVETNEDPAQFEGGWPGHQYFPSPGDWRELPVYQLLTDRFADGDPSNNGIWPHQLTDFDVRDMTLRHGGDFKGITANLDYIHGLGCRVIWISPVFQNGYNAYHGCVQDTARVCLCSTLPLLHQTLT